MAFKPGEITTTDLSPNANILGTQIADNTIQLRNLTDDTFRIVKTGTISGTYPAAGNQNTITVPHGLGLTPVCLVFLSGGGFFYPLPAVPAFGNGGALTGIRIDQLITASVDSTNLYIQQILSPQSGAGGTATQYRYYLLQEKASIT